MPSREDSWSRMFAEVNDELREEERRIEAGDEECLTGEHGARLTVERRQGAYVYGFGTECGVEQAGAVLKWPEFGLPDVVRGEKVLRTIPAAYAQVLDDRSTLVIEDLDSLADVAEQERAATGAYPATLDAERLEELEVWTSSERIDYQPGADRSSFRLCVQSVPTGPWMTWDSTRPGGIASLGDSGRCSFDPPPAGSLREVRRDLLALSSEVLDDASSCKRVPPTRQLRERGVLSPGNQVAGCQRHSWQEDAVHTISVCVQHGADGPWATYDLTVGTVTGTSGLCDLKVEEPVRGPWY